MNPNRAACALLLLLVIALAARSVEAVDCPNDFKDTSSCESHEECAWNVEAKECDDQCIVENNCSPFDQMGEEGCGPDVGFLGTIGSGVICAFLVVVAWLIRGTWVHCELSTAQPRRAPETHRMVRTPPAHAPTRHMPHRCR